MSSYFFMRVVHFWPPLSVTQRRERGSQRFDKNLKNIVRLESNMCHLHSYSFKIALYGRKLQLHDGLLL